MNKKLISMILGATAAVCAFGTLSASAASTKTKSWSEESWPIGLYYTGYAQCQGAYKIPSNPGYLLNNYVGKYIKQAGFWYQRGNKEVCTRTYTRAASSKQDYNTYSVNKKVWDSMNPWATKTEFYRAYIAF